MPRGNLEVVSPRALVLAAVAAHLQVPFLPESNLRTDFGVVVSPRGLVLAAVAAHLQVLDRKIFDGCESFSSGISGSTWGFALYTAVDTNTLELKHAGLLVQSRRRPPKSHPAKSKPRLVVDHRLELPSHKSPPRQAAAAASRVDLDCVDSCSVRTDSK